MYKKWLKERLKKAETMTAYTIYKNELDRIEGIELLLLVKARLRAKIESLINKGLSIGRPYGGVKD